MNHPSNPEDHAWEILHQLLLDALEAEGHTDAIERIRELQVAAQERDECRRKLDVMRQHIDRLEDIAAIYETEREEAVFIAKGLSAYYSWQSCPECRCAIPTGLVCGVCGTDPTTTGR